MEKLKDLSPIMVKFLNESDDKNLCLLSAPTGSGKSYSVRKFCAEVKNNLPDFTDITFGSNNKLDKVIILCTNRKDVLDMYKKVSEEVGKETCVCIDNRIETYYRNREKIRDLFDDSEIFFSRYIRSDSFNLRRFLGVISELNEHQEQTNDLFDEYRYYFELAIRDYIKDKWEEHVLNTKEDINDIKAELEFLHSSHSFDLFFDLIPGIAIAEKKFIFMTVSRLCYPIKINPSLTPYVFSMPSDKNKYLYIIDEMDEAKGYLLSYIIDSSIGTYVNVLDKFNISNLSERSIPDFNEDKRRILLEKIKTFEEEKNTLEREYGIQRLSLIKDYSQHTLFVDNASEVIDAHNESEGLNYIIESNKTLLIENKDVLKYEKESYEFTPILKRIIVLFYSLLEIIDELVQLKMEEDRENGNVLGKSRDELTKGILKEYLHESDIKTLNHLSALVVRHYIPQLNRESFKTSLDFYHKPGAVITIKNSETNDTVHIKSAEMDQTPESMLLNLISTQKVIGMSATIKNKSIFYNFDFEYPELKERIWEISEEDNDLIVDYCKSRNGDLGNIDLNIDFLPIMNDFEENDNYVKSFVNTASNADKREWQRLYSNFYNNLHNKIVTRKDDDKSKESTFNYYYQQYSSILYAIINAYNNNYHKIIIINSFGDKNENHQLFFNLVKEINILINKNDGRKIKISSATKNDLEETNDEINNLLSSDEGYNYTCVIMGPFPAIGKGCNLQFKTKDERIINEYVPINEQGEQILDEWRMSGKNKEIELDCDMLYIGDKTYVLNDSNETNIGRELTRLYFTGSLYESHCIDEYRKLELFKKASIQEKNPQTPVNQFFDEERKSIAYTAGICKEIEQAAGRLMRTAFRKKNTALFVNSNIACNIQSSSIQLLSVFDKNEWATKPEYIKKVISSIFENKIDVVTSNIEAPCRRAQEYIDDILRNINNPETVSAYIGKYNAIKFGIRKIALTQKEYSQLDNNVKLFYTKIKPEILRSEGYSFSTNKISMLGTKLAKKVFPSYRKECTVSERALGFNLLPRDIREQFLMNGFRFNASIETPYILLPPGVDILYGNIGEFIVDNFLLDSFSFDDMPLDIIEKFDFIYQVNETHFKLIDAKYYRVHDEKYDGEEFKDKILNKAFAVKKYLESKLGHEVVVDCFVINTRYNIDGLTMQENFYDSDVNDIHLITYPNIYDENGDLSNEKLYKIKSLVGEIIPWQSNLSMKYPA